MAVGFRLERWPGGTCTHWKSAALPRRTPKVIITATALDRWITRCPSSRTYPLRSPFLTKSDGRPTGDIQSIKRFNRWRNTFRFEFGPV